MKPVRIEINNMDGEWVWRGMLTARQVYALANYADSLSDGIETQAGTHYGGIWHGENTKEFPGGKDKYCARCYFEDNDTVLREDCKHNKCELCGDDMDGHNNNNARCQKV